jgi:hypothetical protein
MEETPKSGENQGIVEVIQKSGPTPPVEHQWKPGQSGNPKGHPKGVPNSKTRLMRLLPLIQKIKNPITEEMEEFTVAEQMDMKMIYMALKGNIQAYREIIDRIEGKPDQKLDMTSGGAPILPPNIAIFNSAPPLLDNEEKVN